LRWLILTYNQIAELPASIGSCALLQKLMLAGNRLASLPEAMVGCVGLEMLRLSANRFEALPDWLLQLPRLAWLAFGGNPVSSAPRGLGSPVARVRWADIELGAKLGEGASGVIYQGHWRPSPALAGRSVAVKLFKGAVTSDGFPADEMAACLAAGNHPNLIGVVGEITGHPAGTGGLVMPWIEPEFKNLAGPPNLTTCTRDIYPDKQRFALPLTLGLVAGLARAAEHLHARGILHGDFYAHNVLYHPSGACYLGDFGAASFYRPQQHGAGAVKAVNAFEAVEVRAFGCLLGELLERCVTEVGAHSFQSLTALHARCLAPEVATRPTFAEITQALDANGFIAEIGSI
jgi:serine/threonine protein kinase